MKKLIFLLPLLLFVGCYHNNPEETPQSPSIVIPQQSNQVSKAEESTAKVNHENQLIIDQMVIDWNQVKVAVNGQDALVNRISTNLEKLKTNTSTIDANTKTVNASIEKINETVPTVKKNEKEANASKNIVQTKLLWFAGICGLIGALIAVLAFLTKNWDYLIGSGVCLTLAVLSIIIRDHWNQIIDTFEVLIVIAIFYGAYWFYNKEHLQLSPTIGNWLKQVLTWLKKAVSWLIPWLSKTSTVVEKEVKSVEAKIDSGGKPSVPQTGQPTSGSGGVQS